MLTHLVSPNINFPPFRRHLRDATYHQITNLSLVSLLGRQNGDKLVHPAHRRITASNMDNTAWSRRMDDVIFFCSLAETPRSYLCTTPATDANSLTVDVFSMSIPSTPSPLARTAGIQPDLSAYNMTAKWHWDCLEMLVAGGKTVGFDIPDRYHALK